jgi:superfamily II DNA or RNA helicase
MKPIEIEVGHTYSKINGILPTYVIEKLDRHLSYFVHNYQFSNAFRRGFWNSRERKYKRWDGKNHLFKKNRFLSGLLWRVEAILKKNEIDYKIIDARKKIPFGPEMPIYKVESREYQQRVVEAVLCHKCGMVQSATGSGKSIMIAQIIAKTNVKTIVYVIGIDLLYQMKETLEKVLKARVGIIGDGQAEIRRINVCTVWTAANALGEKYVPLDDEDSSKDERFDAQNKAKIAKIIAGAEMIFFDEGHMLGTQTLQSINKSSKSAYYKYAMSGTCWRDDNADLLLEAVCGKIIIEISASELIKSGHLVKPKITFVNVPEKKNLSPNYHSIYKKYIVENPSRNNKIISVAEKLVKKGRKVLILVKNIKHGQILLSKFSKNFVVYFVRGEVKSEERNLIRKKFLRGEIDIIIASIVYDQGIDLVNLDALILAGSGKATGRALQRLGRVLRPFKGKKDAIVIDFWDNAKYLQEHSRKRLQIYRRETGFEIKLPKVKNAKKKSQTKSQPMQNQEKWGKMRW